MEELATAVRALYDELGRAIVANDAAALVALVADNFQKVNLDGTAHTLDEWKVRLERQMAAVDYHDAHCHVNKLAMTSDNISVYVTKRLAGSQDNGARVHSVVQSRDTLSRVGSKLLISQTDTFTLDRMEHEHEGLGTRSWRTRGDSLLVEELAVTKALEQMNGSPT